MTLIFESLFHKKIIGFDMLLVKCMLLTKWPTTSKIDAILRQRRPLNLAEIIFHGWAGSSRWMSVVTAILAA